MASACGTQPVHREASTEHTNDSQEMRFDSATTDRGASDPRRPTGVRIAGLPVDMPSTKREISAKSSLLVAMNCGVT